MEKNTGNARAVVGVLKFQDKYWNRVLYASLVIFLAWVIYFLIGFCKEVFVMQAKENKELKMQNFQMLQEVNKLQIYQIRKMEEDLRRNREMQKSNDTIK